MFEGFDKPNQVGSVAPAFGEEVQVVRHNTVSVNRKTLAGRDVEELDQQPSTKSFIFEDECAALGADGYKVDAPPDIIMVWKSKV